MKRRTSMLAVVTLIFSVLVAAPAVQAAPKLGTTVSTVTADVLVRERALTQESPYNHYETRYYCVVGTLTVDRQCESMKNLTTTTTTTVSKPIVKTVKKSKVRSCPPKAVLKNNLCTLTVKVVVENPPVVVVE